MKILQVCQKYYPYKGGVAEHVRNLSERLAEKYEVIVATTDPSGKLPRDEIVNSVKIQRFKCMAPRNSYYFSRILKKYLMKNSDKFDIVHAHNYHVVPSFYAAQSKDRNVFVFTPHYHGSGRDLFNSLLHIPYKFLGKRIFQKADRIICVSRFEKNLILKNFKINEDKIRIIPNGVNLEEFTTLKRKNDYQSILFVGRLEKYKGAEYLIKVLPKLDNNIVLEIVGKGVCKKSLVKLAKDLEVSDRVKFFEDLERKELLQRYADADLFILLSKYEAYAITVAEALASRTPCILANTSALKEWIDFENAFGIDYPINLDHLANLVNKVIGKKIGKLSIPDWRNITNDLITEYEELLSIS